MSLTRRCGVFSHKGQEKQPRLAEVGGVVHPMDANFANIDVGFASPLPKILCSTTYEVIMY